MRTLQRESGQPRSRTAARAAAYLKLVSDLINLALPAALLLTWITYIAWEQRWI